MPHVADTDTGAARQKWWAASAVLALLVAQGVAFLQAPDEPRAADFLFNLAFAAAGVAATRLMLSDGGGRRRLLDVWAAVARWGLPAMAVVMAAVLATGVALLPPADLKAQAGTALWTAVGAGNVQAMHQGGIEPALGGELLLHLWPTGVAVQLFLVWTLAIALLTRLRLTPLRLRRAVGGLAALGIVLSLGLEFWLRGRGLHLQAFYLAPANAWPFLIGAQYGGLPAGPFRPDPHWRSLLARHGGLVWPFYLWLWPVLAFPQMILARSATPVELAAALAGAAVLALATRWGIEAPIRRRLGYRPGATIAAAGAALAAIGLVSVAIFASGGLPARADARLRAEEAAVLQRPALQSVCHVDGERTPPMTACTTPPDGSADVIVWGNSHAAQLTPAILDWTSRRGLRMRQVTKSGCLPLLVSADGLANAECLAFNRAAVSEMAGGPKPRLVVLGAAWTLVMARSPGEDVFEARALERDLAATVRRVRTAVGPEARIVLLGDTPDFAFAPAACHARRRFLGLDGRRCDLAPPANARMAWTMEDVLNRVAAGEPGVTVFDPAATACSHGLCRTRGPEGPWYVDSHHLTPAGGLARSRALARVLDTATAGR